MKTKFVNLYNESVHLLLYEKNYRQAISNFSQIIEKYPQHKDTLIYLAMAYDGIKDFETAKKYYSEAQKFTSADLSRLNRTSQYKKVESLYHLTKNSTDIEIDIEEEVLIEEII